MPHNSEWEHKRLADVRKAGREGRIITPWKGKHRPVQHTKPMILALEKWKSEYPGKARQNAINNLPKDCSGSKNGNWKGGITLSKKGLRWSLGYKRWRQTVLSRDKGKCRICGSSSNLQVHHIVSMSECPEIACLEMNGVCLCRKHHYENDEAWQGKRFQKQTSIGKSLVLVFTIPHKFQSYETVGNWSILPTGTVVIFVSKLSDWRYEALIAVHELWEVILCKHHKIKQEDVDKFDRTFEDNRKDDDDSEPGDDPRAPYRREHCSATGVERILAAELGVVWKDYEDELSNL